MKTKSRFIWFAGASFASLLLMMGIMLALFWQSLAPFQRQILADLIKAQFSYLFSAAVLLLAGLGFILDWFFRFYIIPVSRLTEEVELMLSVNPSFRTRTDGSKDVTRLGRLINEGADRFQRLQNTVTEKIELAQAESQVEKSILATMMSELPAGVLICNDQGQILLYNRKAKQFLGSRPGAQPTTREGSRASQPFLGLGRSIFGIMDKGLVVHALDEIAAKLERQTDDVAAYFVLVGQNNELLRAEVVPILDQDQLVTGLIMLLTDITAKVSREHHLFRQQRRLLRQLRKQATAIRCSAELLETYADIPAQRQRGLISLIADQSAAMGDLINQDRTDVSPTDTRWPVVPMLAADLLASIKRKSAEQLKLNVQIHPHNCHAQVKVDSYALVLAVSFVLHNLKSRIETDHIDAYLQDSGDLVYLDICYPGEKVDSASWRQWHAAPLHFMEEYLPVTLAEVLDHHRAEFWTLTRNDPRPMGCLRLFLPACESDDGDHHVRRMTILPEARPEFYDFDLFQQPGQNPLSDNRLLTELSYTVFDTETTGLDPAGGDEIISIGAVRVLHNRLLREEFFDQLVNPQRSLPYASTKIHGIQPEMLENQPTIDQVLKIFHAFCEDTILVAHNAAFDMRMLQLKEEETGVRFVNPVLDTMHLSAVVHPAQEDHSISAIAHRMGISVVGRHTALGDAITTGEIFLKLTPLLAEKGIHTLAEARRASQKTYYARIKY
ncbi:MAG: exonuclease domain-containing protein [Desulfosarcinaceae bacterium]|nr:exonuclease domain-containing protein [Desulfosarcinaceae bacterium]